MYELRAPVVSNEPVTETLHVLWVRTPELARDAKPGQFAMVATNDVRWPLLRRPFSVHRVRRGGQGGSDKVRRALAPDEAAILYANVGAATNSLASLRPGDELALLGPLGRGFSIAPRSENLLLIAGGRGVAPLVHLAEVAAAKGKSVTLIMGGAGASDIVPSELLPAEAEVVVATDDGSLGHAGFVTDLVPEYLAWADQVFACGPQPMYAGLARVIPEDSRSKDVQVLAEEVMACGVGACLGCAVKTNKGMKLVCRQGPRFSLWEVV